MAQRVQELPYYLVQMKAHFSLIRDKYLGKVAEYFKRVLDRLSTISEHAISHK